MELWQQIILIGFFLYSFLAFLFGALQCKKKCYLNSSHIFYLTGAFVWADAVVFGLFWMIAAVVIFLLNDFLFFLSFFFLFWTVRNFGEAQYWFNHQFSTVRRYPIKKSWAYKFFKDEYTCEVIFQILWQCLTVVSLVAAIYITYLWLSYMQ